LSKKEVKSDLTFRDKEMIMIYKCLDRLEKAIKYVAEWLYTKRTGYFMEGLNKILKEGGV